MALIKICVGLCFFIFGSVGLAETGVTAKVIRIGSTKNLSEGDKTRPVAISRGQKLFFDKLNRAGGVHGRTIEFIEYDDAFDPKRSADNVKRLINDDKVFAIFGAYGTANLKATAPLLSAASVPAFAVVASLGVLPPDQLKQIFAVKANYVSEAEQMVQYAVQKKKWKKLVVLTQDDALGNEGRGGLLKELHRNGLQPSLVKLFSRRAEELTDALAEGIVEVKPDAILMFANEPSGRKAIEILTRAKIKAPMFFSSSMVAESVVKQVEALGVASSFFQSYPLASQVEVPIVAEYVKETTRAGAKPNDAEATGYIDAAIFAEALQLVGADLTREKFLSVVETKMKELSIRGVTVSFSPTDHDGFRGLRVYHNKGGVLVAD